MGTRNNYTQALGNFFTVTPKAVFAAVAFSFANRLFAKSEGTEVADIILEEWQTLYANGIVPQKPPRH